MSKHTPTPWGYWKDCCRDGGMITSSGGGHVCAPTWHATNPQHTLADAVHIVKCVNAHDELMEFVDNLRCVELPEWAIKEAKELLKKYGGK